jgi:hypothetical protein
MTARRTLVASTPQVEGAARMLAGVERGSEPAADRQGLPPFDYLNCEIDKRPLKALS